VTAQPKIKEAINANSILLLIVIGLSTWTLKKVSELSETQAVLLYRVNELEKKKTVSTGHPPGLSSATSPILGQLNSSLPSR
jgi:hypothetical protein